MNHTPEMPPQAKPVLEQAPVSLETSLPEHLETAVAETVESIRTNGREASMGLIFAWSASAHAWTDESGLERMVRNRRMVIMNFETYQFYVASGDTDGAMESIEDAIYQAGQEGFDDMIPEMEKKLGEISASDSK